MLKKLRLTVREVLKFVVYQLGAFRPIAFFNYAPYKRRVSSFTISKPSARGQAGLSRDPEVTPEKNFFMFTGAKPGQEEEYLAAGEKRVSKMRELATDSGFSFDPGNRILEFGCSGGRLIRHLEDLAESCEIWGVDVDASSIYWCKQHLSPPFNFATTTNIPHLPFEDRYFDFIYCGSVFTHIDDLTEAWLLELRRILSPSGRLYITIQDNQSIELLKTTYTNVKSLDKGIKLYDQSKNDFAMIVFDRNTGNTDTFFDLDYFRKILSPIYEVFSVTKEAFGHQTAVLVQRK